MAWLILILVLIAAAFGILGAVIKAAVFLVLTIVTVILMFVAIGYWLVRHQISKANRTVHETPLPPPRDDRY